MAKRDVDQKVKKAITALLADKETAVRDLAEAIDKIEAADEQIANLIASRNGLVDQAEKAHATAKSAGWKVRELADAGLSLPKPIDASLTTNTSATAASADGSGDPDGHGAGDQNRDEPHTDGQM